MILSKYLKPYLDANTIKGVNNGFTIQTWIKYELKNQTSQPMWFQGCTTSLTRACEQAVKERLAVKGISVHGFDAYYWVKENHVKA